MCAFFLRLRHPLPSCARRPPRMGNFWANSLVAGIMEGEVVEDLDWTRILEGEVMEPLQDFHII